MTADAIKLTNAIEAACRRIAPTWPLDQFIAVNPWWGHVDQPIEHASASLSVLGGARTLIDRSILRDALQHGTLTREHLRASIARSGAAITADSLIQRVHAPAAAPARLPLLSDVVDGNRDLTHAVAWSDEIVHDISQRCATWFDRHQASWRAPAATGLYGSWRQAIARNHGVRLLMGRDDLVRRALRLPTDAGAAIEFVLAALSPPAEATEHYLTALLLSVNGWAAWCAYERWQARLAGGDDTQIVDLLAIRLSWEWLLDDGQRGPGTPHAHWLESWRCASERIARCESEQQQDWLLQQALEMAYQQPLIAALSDARAAVSPSRPAAQAIFCIDVRSEVFRRALEATSGQVQTLGFAGFFGLPVSYTPLGTLLARPQLPGLLAPAFNVQDQCVDDATRTRLTQRRWDALDSRDRWQGFRTTPSSAFTFVESLGWTYAARLLRSSFASRRAVASADRFGLPARDAARVRPTLRLGEDAASGAMAGAELAARILRAMGLTQGHARLVLLTGHGSQSANNPHAAGLDCGACCGQTGEVNARALAALLNDPAVRTELVARHSVQLPSDTWFLAAQHNTTTDDVECFDIDRVPASHREDLTQLRQWLRSAGDLARAERAPKLGLGALATNASRLHGAIQERANDWAQLRPEWALADCAAFIVAPRARSRDVNLAGRSFLHDYDWQNDPDNSVLELIMTAPMIVTHWISMQYYASTLDNRRYGSGNKVLHNVVGGRIGVFEGNSGDLRIGLPWQSLHDGEKLMHTPQRLSVIIEAPRARIDAVISRHELVRQLLHHGWLHLFRLEPNGSDCERYTPAGWFGQSL